MKKKRRRRGRYRYIIIMVILVAAVAAVFRIASGSREKSPDQEAAVNENGSFGVSGVEDIAGTAVAAAEISANSGQLNPEMPAGSDEFAAGTQSGAAATAAVSEAGSAGAAGGTSGDGTAASAGSAGAAGGTSGDGTAASAGSAGAGEASSTAQTEAKQPYDHVKSEIEKGREYLEHLDQRSPADMENDIALKREEYLKKKDREEYLEKREAYRQTLEEDGVWEQFKDYVFLGDSRVVGYDVFGYLPSERVLAVAGDTILAISDNMDRVRELDPRYIFISYGINDVGIGFWQNGEEYVDAFREKIGELQKEFPDAQIFVNSIIPATEEAVAGMPVWGKTPEFSEAVRSMCLEDGIPFIDNGPLIEEHSDLYAGDGVHLQTEFYSYWAENQLLAIYDLKNGRASDGSRLSRK